MNTFGRLFTFTTFGESHGPGIGVVVDGCPARLPLDADDIQPWLDRRRPGQGTHTTARREPDHVRILSGVHEGLTTGAPIALYVDNVNQHSADYDQLADVFRPGHADWTWTQKYGHRDPRGGGRTSARETLTRVAAGAIARKMLAVAAETNPAELPRPITVTGALVAMGPVSCRPECWNPSGIAANPFYASDPDAVPAMRELLDTVRAAGSSVGGVVEVRVDGVPPGWGEPLYDRLDARLAAAFMGVNAVKGVEIGDGFAAAVRRGEDNNDAMRPGADGIPDFASNHAGGVLGGLSTGQTLRVRCALKPTPSIAVPQDAVDRAGQARRLVVGGRHDPCVAIRAVPVLEAMAACVSADFFLLARARRPL